MADEPQGDTTYLIPLPAYALSRFAARDANTGELALSAKVDFLSSRTEEGICLALFTNSHAAESYRNGRNLATGFEVTQLDSLELLCVLSRMGAVCELLMVDMSPSASGGLIVGLESMRQRLLASHRASLAAAI